MPAASRTRRALADLESGRRWTYAALDRAADGVAAWLAARLGPASGERVAVLARNCAEMLILQLGCDPRRRGVRAAELAARPGRAVPP